MSFETSLCHCKFDGTGLAHIIHNNFGVIVTSSTTDLLNQPFC